MLDTRRTVLSFQEAPPSLWPSYRSTIRPRIARESVAPPASKRGRIDSEMALREYAPNSPHSAVVGVVFTRRHARCKPRVKWAPVQRRQGPDFSPREWRENTGV